jgi:TetR/AcrR family transcriptional regulator, mexJK operon transcriptional repressor
MENNLFLTNLNLSLLADVYIINKFSPTKARIMKAARELFLVHGFSAVSTDKLCKEAGVSKTSLYKYFGDMSGVLSAVVLMQGDVVTVGTTQKPQTEAAFWDSLINYGTNLLTLLNQKQIIEFDRMLHEQSRKHFNVAQSFYDASYGRTHVELTAMIQVGKENGFIKKAQSAEQLADYLFCIWQGLSFVKTRLGLIEKPFADPKVRVLNGLRALFGNENVGKFLNGKLLSPTEN